MSPADARRRRGSLVFAGSGRDGAGARASAERAFKEFIEYRLYSDLQRGWRIVPSAGVRVLAIDPVPASVDTIAYVPGLSTSQIVEKIRET